MIYHESQLSRLMLTLNYKVERYGEFYDCIIEDGLYEPFSLGLYDTENAAYEAGNEFIKYYSYFALQRIKYEKDYPTIKESE